MPPPAAAGRDAAITIIFEFTTSATPQSTPRCDKVTGLKVSVNRLSRPHRIWWDDLEGERIMAFRTLLSGWTLTLAGLATAAALSAGAVLATSSETVLRNSFSTALGSPVPSGLQVAKSAPVAGTEDFWLTASRAEGGLAVTKAVSVGDHFALTLGGQNRHFEVAAVSDYAPLTTEIDIRANQSRLVIVTARDTRASSTRSIRFVMEIEQNPVSAIGAKARAL